MPFRNDSPIKLRNILKIVDPYRDHNDIISVVRQHVTIVTTPYRS